MGGREFLLRNGKTFLSPRPAIADERHPRTAIGLKADGGVVLATVDGRRSGYSIGVTNAELATMLAGQGAIDAINLDGGGSTAMAVRQPGDLGVSIVNRPSDGSERVLPNALVVYSSAPTGPLAYLYMKPGSTSMYTGGTANFTLKGQDAAYNGIPVSPSQATWTVEGAGGTVDPNGRFTAGAPGSGAITAIVNGVSATSCLTVLTDTSPPNASPPSVRLLVGKQLGSPSRRTSAGMRPRTSASASPATSLRATPVARAGPRSRRAVRSTGPPRGRSSATASTGSPSARRTRPATSAVTRAGPRSA